MQISFCTITIFCCVAALSFSCASNEVDSPTCTTQVSFASHISPIVTQKCAIEGCHNGDNGADRNWTDFALFQKNAANVKTKVTSHEMPPPGSGITLSATEINLISCWVDQGAQNN